MVLINQDHTIYQELQQAHNELQLNKKIESNFLKIKFQ